MKTSVTKPGIWGISVALSWTWGLGLFFAVQFTFQFGLAGLLSFAIPNAIGLFLFGLGTDYIATKKIKDEGLEPYFGRWTGKFSNILLFYQIIALSLTIFAFSRYVFQALELPNPVLMLILVVLALLATAFLLGEQFGIRKIKYSHAVFFGLLLLCAGLIWCNKSSVAPIGNGAQSPQQDLNFLSYLIPVCIGFLTGPWLDLQQWQRAIQMQKEKVSITKGYFWGALIFFCILIFHGSLTLWAVHQGAASLAHQGIDGIFYAQDIIVRYLNGSGSFIKWTYFGFLAICIITTLDSGYVSLKWFFQNNTANKQNIIYSVLPQKLLTSPIPAFILCGIIALVAMAANLELEYFMVFYATYFVGYAMVGIIQSLHTPTPAFQFTATKMFAVSCLSLVIAGIGYMHRTPALLIAGTIIPVVYGFYVATKKRANAEIPKLQNAQSLVAASPIQPQPETNLNSQQAGSIEMASEYVEGKWYVHSFRATYGDTNSVGNVYFGMYAMWVGKTRELFFNHCLPDFDLKTTSFYILTRSFEHKFAHEAREFDIIKVKIRVKDFNRKFATLEHRITDQNNRLLGKGSQSLLFVDAKSYEQLNIPAEVLTGFIPFTN